MISEQTVERWRESSMDSCPQLVHYRPSSCTFGYMFPMFYPPTTLLSTVLPQCCTHTLGLSPTDWAGVVIRISTVVIITIIIFI